jgi:hypothetical protein
MRVDAYWLGGELERSSIKVRAVVDPRSRRVRARRTELKVLQRRLGAVRLAPHLIGTPELWLKSRSASTPASLGLSQPRQPIEDWVLVEKRRVRLRAPGQVPGTSTSVELTELRALDRAAWSVSAQARGPVPVKTLRPMLRATLRDAFPTWPDALLLGPGDCASYGAWLHRSLVSAEPAS